MKGRRGRRKSGLCHQEVPCRPVAEAPLRSIAPSACWELAATRGAQARLRGGRNRNTQVGPTAPASRLSGEGQLSRAPAISSWPFPCHPCSPASLLVGTCCVFQDPSLCSRWWHLAKIGSYPTALGLALCLPTFSHMSFRTGISRAATSLRSPAEPRWSHWNLLDIVRSLGWLS